MGHWRLLVLGCLLVVCGCQATPQQFAPDLSGPAVPWTHRNFGDGGRDFHFAIMSDRNGGMRPGVFETAVDKLNLLQPEFVICVGDLIGGNTKDEVKLRRQQEEFDGIVGKLKMPFFYVPGNHDISNDVAAAAWRSRYGRPYYHFLYKGALFLVLCTEGPQSTRLGDEQIAYVRKVLEANRSVRWTFLFMHNPLFAEEQPGEGIDPAWQRIQPMLAGRGHTVFAGHRHGYAIYQHDGNNYIRLATTGGSSDLLGKDFGSFDHIVWVTVRHDGPKIANLMLDGIQDENVTTEEMARRSYELLEGVQFAVRPMLATSGPAQPAQTMLTFTNKTDLPATVVAVFQPSSRLLPTPASAELRLAPKSEKTLDLVLQPTEEVPIAELKPLTLSYSVSYDMPEGTKRKFDFNVGVGITQARVCRRTQTPIVIDGNLDDWGELPIVVDEPAQIEGDVDSYSGPNDCRFRFATAYDDEYFYVAVDVTDDNVYLDEKSSPENQDAAWISVNAEPDPARSSGAGGRTFAVLLCPGKDPTNANIDTSGRKPKNTKRGAARTARGYAVEFAIPISYLNELQGGQWQGVRLNVAVQDRDAPGKMVKLYWQADWRSPQAVWGSGTFQRQ